MEGDGSKKNKNELTKDSGTSMTFQCPVLNSTNYTIWALRIRAIFNVHGIWEAVEPTAGTEVDQKKNNTAVAMLYQALPENMILQIANLTSAKDVGPLLGPFYEQLNHNNNHTIKLDIWDALKVRHIGVDRVKEARLQTLESGFESLKMDANDSLDVFAGKISEIASQASSLGHTLDDKRLVRKVLGSVPEKFIQIVAAIEQFADLNTMPFQEAVGRLKAFEERTKKQTKEEDVTSRLLFTEADKNVKDKHQRCEHCGCGNSNQGDFGRGQGRGQGSRKGQGDSGVQRDKSHIRCHKCHELGHYRNECPKSEKKEEANLIWDVDDEPTLL